MIGKVVHIVPDKRQAILEYEEAGEVKKLRMPQRCKLDGIKSLVMLGDEIQFELDYPDGYIKVVECKLLGNPLIERLESEYVEDKVYHGYCKKSRKGFCFKEIDTYICFPIQLEDVDIAPEVDSLCRCYLNHEGSMRKANAVLVDKIIDDEVQRFWDQARKMNTFKAHVVEVRSRELVVKLDDYELQGTVPFKEGENTYEEGESIIVWSYKSKGKDLHFRTIM